MRMPNQSLADRLPHWRGEKHPNWKGDNAQEQSKRRRARKLFPLPEKCESCEAKATQRHHKDGDPGNNVPSNIMFVCHRCHVLIDGRLKAFIEVGINNLRQNRK